MLEFIDTHSHIYDEAFSSDFHEVIQRAKEAGVSSLVLPAIDISSYQAMMDCAATLGEYAHPCIGLHPTSVSHNWEEELSFVKDRIKDHPFSAIGEIGIDLYWSKEFMEQQKRVFAEQIEIAAKHSLPIIVHSREATAEIFSVLEETKGLQLKGTFHAFSGSYETYKRILTYGDFKVGIGGVLTYKNAGIASVLEKMSLSDIILETDCPWLTPVPHRGKRNESSYILFVADMISRIKNISLQDVAQTTTASARKLFNI